MSRNRVGFLVLVLLVTASLTAAPSVQAEGSTLSVPCKNLGGAVEFHVGVLDEELLLTVAYPKSIASYLGGYVDGTKDYSADVVLYLDTDANPKTGAEADDVLKPGAAGSEFSIGAEEIKRGGLYRLDLNVKKRGDDLDFPGASPTWQIESGGAFQKADWANVPDSKRMQTTVPLSMLNLQPGAKIRVTGVGILCNDSRPYPSLQETTLTLE